MVIVVVPVFARLVGLKVTVASEGAPVAENPRLTGVVPVPQVSVPVKTPEAPGAAVTVNGVTESVTSRTVRVQGVVPMKFDEATWGVTL